MISLELKSLSRKRYGTGYRWNFFAGRVAVGRSAVRIRTNRQITAKVWYLKWIDKCVFEEKKSCHARDDFPNNKPLVQPDDSRVRQRVPAYESFGSLRNPEHDNRWKYRETWNMFRYYYYYYYCYWYCFCYYYCRCYVRPTCSRPTHPTAVVSLRLYAVATWSWNGY